MALMALGTCVGFSSNPYKHRETGEQRYSHKLAVSTGDATEELTLDDDLLRDLGPDVQRLRLFGQPVRCRVRVGAFGRDNGTASVSLRVTGIEFLTRAELALAGGELPEVYVEDDPAPTGNGSELTVA